MSVARFSHGSHPKHSEAHSAREQGSAFPVEAQPRYKIRHQLTRHPRTYRVSRSFSLQEICSREDRRFLFSLQQPETDVDGQALWHFALLYFGAIISSAGGVLSRVLRNFFSLEDLHEVFSPRSTRYNPRAGPAFPPFHYFEFKFNIWKAHTPIAAHSRTFFFTRRSFFPRSAEDLRKPRLLRAWFSPPAPTAPPDQLRCPMHGSCNLLSPRQVRLLVFVRS